MALIRPQRQVSRSVGLSILALTALSFVLAGTIIVMFLALIERHNATEQSVRENALWAAYQADREASRLVESLSRHDLEATQTHYDILYSRVSLIGSGQYAVSFTAQSQVGRKAMLLADSVFGMVETMDLLRSRPELFSGRRLSLLQQASAARLASADLIMTANAAISESKVHERAEEQAAYWNLGLAVVILTAALIAMIGLLAIQIVQASRAGRKLEMLSRKSERTAEAALAASRAKSVFLATMSHEIRTPLNGILGMAELLSSTPLSADQRQSLRAIRTSADLLLDVISDVLDYSKLEATGVQIERAPHDLRALGLALHDILGGRAAAAGLAFTVELPALEAHIDAGRLRQVLINLAGNAIKFTPQGGVVSITGRVLDDRLRVEVSDTGPGISGAAQAHLFKEFSQVDGSNTRTHGGTGLGLAISKRLMEAMGGQIGVTSEIGKGSLFWVELPAGPMTPVERLGEPRQGGTQGSRFTGRALVVEDNAINRQVAGGFLRNLGLEVEFAEHGQEALDIVARNPPDLVLMDMQMPVMDGLDATRHLRASGFSRPIIGLTANAFTTDREACLAAGMDRFIAKPATRDKLATVLATLLTAAPPEEDQGTEEAAEETSRPVVDAEYRRMLIDEFGAEDFAELARRFLSDAPGLVAEARRASATADTHAYDAALHRLKGAALTVGFNALAQRAQELRVGPPADGTALAALDDEIDRARAA